MPRGDEERERERERACDCLTETFPSDLLPARDYRQLAFTVIGSLILPYCPAAQHHSQSS